MPGDAHLQSLMSRMPEAAELDALLSGDPVDTLLGLANDRAVIDIGLELQAKADADEAEVTAALETATAAAAIVAREGDQATLSPEQMDALELFVMLSSRPSIFVVDGSVRDRPANWPQLERDRELIERRVSGVGRIELSPGGRDNAVGTGFLVGENRVMTNNHVLAGLFGARSPTWWSVRPDWFAGEVSGANTRWPDGDGPVFELIGELGSDRSSTSRVTGVVGHHLEVDLAVLEIAGVPEGGRQVRLAAVEPEELSGRSVYALGYPMQPGRRESAPVIQRIFGDGDALRTKRCSPGKITGRVSASEILHDASTLPGSSGSAIVDFELDEVVALHYAGVTGAANKAVPVWTLREDPVLVDGGVVFGG